MPDVETQSSIFIGRRPIFDKKMGVWGYALRFWEDTPSNARDAASEMRLLLDGVNLVLPCLEASRKVVVPVSRALLAQPFESALPKGRVVIELSSVQTVDPNMIKACQRLKAAGFQLMMGDDLWRPEMRALRPLIDVHQIELPRPVNQLSAELEGFRGHRLVSRVEDRDILNYMWKLGFGNFSLFQGAFFCKPEVVSGRRLSAGELARMRLMSELSREDFSPARIGEILQSDASITLRLFNYVNAADLGLRNKVTSIQHAITVLGESQMKTWLRVVLMSELSRGVCSDALLPQASQRARFLELACGLAQRCPLPPPSMFLVGLFSLLDAMLGMPMQDILISLPLEDGIRAMLMDAANPWRALVAAYEADRWDEAESQCHKLGLDPRQVAHRWTQALQWSLEVSVLST